MALPAGFMDPQHRSALVALVNDETAPAAVRHDIASTLTAWRRACDLVSDLRQQAATNGDVLKQQKVAAAEVLLEKLTASDKRPNLNAVLSDLKASEATADDLERSIPVAERAASMAAQRRNAPLARWGVEGWTWCALQRVAAGMNGTVERHVAYVWRYLSRPVIVPWPIVQNTPGKVPLDAKRTPSLEPYPADQSQLLQMAGIRPKDRTADLAPDIYRALAGVQADWFALLCIAHGRVEERAGRWYATAHSDEFDTLREMASVEPVS